jgi:hypothetical protein
VALACIALALATGCGYWNGRPASDTGPVRWGNAPGGSHSTNDVAQGTTWRGAAPSGGSQGVEERLSNLESLRLQGMIGQAEYRQRRQAILDAAFD